MFPLPSSLMSLEFDIGPQTKWLSSSRLQPLPRLMHLAIQVRVAKSDKEKGKARHDVALMLAGLRHWCPALRYLQIVDAHFAHCVASMAKLPVGLQVLDLALTLRRVMMPMLHRTVPELMAMAMATAVIYLLRLLHARPVRRLLLLQRNAITPCAISCIPHVHVEAGARHGESETRRCRAVRHPHRHQLWDRPMEHRHITRRQGQRQIQNLKSNRQLRPCLPHSAQNVHRPICRYRSAGHQ